MSPPSRRVLGRLIGISSLAHRLQSENAALRRDVASLEADSHRFKSQLAAAREELEDARIRGQSAERAARNALEAERAAMAMRPPAMMPAYAMPPPVIYTGAPAVLPALASAAAAAGATAAELPSISTTIPAIAPVDQRPSTAPEAQAAANTQRPGTAAANRPGTAATSLRPRASLDPTPASRSAAAPSDSAPKEDSLARRAPEQYSKAPFATGVPPGAQPPTARQLRMEAVADKPTSARPHPSDTSAVDKLGPFASDKTLQEALTKTQVLEESLMRLCMERTNLESEYSKMPPNGGRTIAERRRKVEVEERMDQLAKEISSARLQLKKLTGRI